MRPQYKMSWKQKSQKLLRDDRFLGVENILTESLLLPTIWLYFEFWSPLVDVQITGSNGLLGQVFLISHPSQPLGSALEDLDD